VRLGSSGPIRLAWIEGPLVYDTIVTTIITIIITIITLPYLPDGGEAGVVVGPLGAGLEAAGAGGGPEGRQQRGRRVEYLGHGTSPRRKYGPVA
jgi:hypothetical protein